jgi:hypothetical protein
MQISEKYLHFAAKTHQKTENRLKSRADEQQFNTVLHTNGQVRCQNEVITMQISTRLLWKQHGA